MSDLPRAVSCQRFDEEFGGGGGAEGQGNFSFQEDGDGVGLGISVGDLDAGSWKQAAVVDELKEAGLLVEDADDLDAAAEGTVDEIIGGGGGDVSTGSGDGIAMRIDGGMSEEGVDAFEKFFRNDVLEFLGFVMNLGPVETDDLDEKELDEAMAA